MSSTEAINHFMKKFVCDHLKVGWYQKETGFNHTGFVLQSNDGRMVTIDFTRPSNCKFWWSSLFGGKYGKVTIMKYDSSYDFKFCLATLTKIEAQEFIERCLKYKAKYDLIFHNCRNFVINMTKELKNMGFMSEEIHCKFWWAIWKIKILNDPKMPFEYIYKSVFH